MRKISLGHFEISSRGREYVNEVLDSGRLSYGPFTERFEKAFASMHGCRHGVFCNSGTSALHISLLALKETYGWDNNSEVLVPATTFIATSNAVIHAGLKPVFVDVDSETFNIDPREIEKHISPRSVAIMPVHLFGMPADMPAITEIASRRGLRIIEDSCEAIQSTIGGKVVGSFGDAACFSTYVAHFVVGGVGGVVTTNDTKVADLCRSLMAHGRDGIYTSIDHDDSSEDVILRDMVERRFRFERIGYSFRATELEAAIALSELERVNDNLETRNENAAALTALLKDASSLQLPVSRPDVQRSFMMYPMLYKTKNKRDNFLLHLEKSGIETRLLFPLLSQPIYQNLFPNEAQQFPVAERINRTGFFIGMHQGLNITDMHYIADAIYEGLS
jgi:perosamine synthetase